MTYSGQKSRQTEKNRQTYRQRRRLINRQAGRNTDRETEVQPYREAAAGG